MLISLCLGALVGAVLGLTGAGGGILAVPALVFGMGWPIQQATPIALVAVAGSAAVGALEAFRRRLVRYRAALLMALAGVPATALGALIARALPHRLLLVLFAMVMLVVAVRLLRQTLAQGAQSDAQIETQIDADHAAPACVAHIDPATGRFAWTWRTAAALSATGATTGLMTGLLGVGGGFIIVPMMRKLTDASMHGIVATSLMVIALVGSGGVLATSMRGTSFPFDFTLWFSAATAAGMLAGRIASQRVSGRYVQIAFGAMLVVVAIGLVVKAAG